MLPGLTSIIAGLSSGGIQFVGYATGDVASGGTGSITINSGLTGGIASAVSDGDFIVAAFATGSSGNATLAITDASAVAYTLIGSELWSDDTNDCNLRVGYKFASGDTQVNFDGGGTSAFGSAIAYVFRGVNASTPLDGVAPTTATGTNTVLADPPSITPSSSGAFPVCVGGGGAETGNMTYASSDLTGFASHKQNNGFSRCGIVGIGHKSDWTSGAFNAAAFTLSVGSDSTNHAWTAISFALRPA